MIGKQLGSFAVRPTLITHPQKRPRSPKVRHSTASSRSGSVKILYFSTFQSKAARFSVLPAGDVPISNSTRHIMSRRRRAAHRASGTSSELSSTLHLSLDFVSHGATREPSVAWRITSRRRQAAPRASTDRLAVPPDARSPPAQHAPPLPPPPSAPPESPSAPRQPPQPRQPPWRQPCA